MSIEQEIFQRRKLKPDTLAPFGFSKHGKVWEYSESFLDGAFRADVRISESGQVLGSVFDVIDGEEYLPVHVESYSGAFVGKVREAYRVILQRIADSCFAGEWFLFPQSNRIAQQIEERYEEKPDFPFASAQTYGVFRYAKNRKWYGMLMDIRESQLTGVKPEEPEESPVIEVLNLKVEEAEMERLLSVPGIWPAYHMKNKSWVSVLLDDTLPDEQILDLLDASRRFAVRAGRKERTGPVNWIVPANPKYYDVDAAFAQNEEILWKQGRGIRVGDTAYLYVAAPVSAIRYRCLITEVDIPYSYHDDNVTMKYVMKIRRERIYPPEQFPMARLRELGIRTFQGVHPVPEAVLEALLKE